MLPAFATPTEIPFGTVNLRHGVPKGETSVSSTAGAGSLLVDFEVCLAHLIVSHVMIFFLQVLSRLTGNPKYGLAAEAAIVALLSKRSEIGLLGKHINIKVIQFRLF